MSKYVIDPKKVEVSLRNMCQFVLIYVKRLLLLALLVALTVGAYAYISAYRESAKVAAIVESENRTDDTNSSNSSDTSGVVALVGEEKATQISELEETLEDIQAQIDTLREFFTNSYFMTTDANNAAVSTGYFVISAPGNSLANILRRYKSALDQKSYLDNVADALDTEPQWIEDSITVNFSANALGYDPYEYTDGESNTGSIFVKVTAPDTEKSEAVLKATLEYSDSLKDVMGKDFDDYTTKIVTQESYTQFDADLNNQQINKQNQLTELTSQASAYRTTLRTLYSEANIIVESDGTYVQEETISPKRRAVEYFVMGLLSVFVGSILLMMIYYINMTKFRSPIQLEKKYRFHLLADYPNTQPDYEKRHSNWLIWEEMSVRAGWISGSTEEQAGKLLAANVNLYKGKAGKLLVCGNAENEKKSYIVETLKKALNEVEVSSAADILTDPDSRNELERVDGIVLVEERGLSRFDSITAEFITAEELNIPVIGVVVV